VHLRGRWRTAAGHFGRRFVGHGPTTSSSAATKLPCQSPRHHPRRNASALAPDAAKRQRRPSTSEGCGEMFCRRFLRFGRAAPAERERGSFQGYFGYVNIK